MTFTPEQLAELEDLAECLMPKADIAKIMGIDPFTFSQLLETNNEIKTAHLRGHLKAKAAIHKSVVNLAKAGSSPAQNLAVSFVREIEQNNTWQYE